MANTEAIQSVVILAVIQAATAVVMVRRKAGARPILGTNMTSQGEAHRQRYCRQALKWLSFN